MKFDDKLLEFATERQREILEAYQHKTCDQIAAEIGCHRTYPTKVLDAVRKRAAKQGYAPEFDMLRTVPDGYLAKGVSTYYNKEGKPAGQWVKSAIDHERQREIMDAAIATMCESIVPCAPIAGPVANDGMDALATLYTFTDYHVGMLAWRREGGADWDCGIAESMGIAAMRALTDGTPAAGHGIVNIQGDFVHYDGFAPVTPTSGHVLDADSRFGRVVEVSIRLIRQLVALALQKHEKVTLLICEGNHDLASSLWLRKLFCALYENEPRITVHDSELPYYVIRHGATMLGFHHGHMKKNAALPMLFAAQFAPTWGETTKRYIHTGHYHHKEDIEHSGCRVIRHPTLAARDAYAARGGYFAERALTAVTYHSKFGEVGTNTVTPEMLEAA